MNVSSIYENICQMVNAFAFETRRQDGKKRKTNIQTNCHMM
jgi:hypothetical protein